jgi:fatty acid desaturase
MAVNVPAATAVPEPSFADLRRMIGQSGLLARQPLYYAFRFPSTLAMLIPGIFVLMRFNNPWVQLLNAVYLAFVFTQIVFLGHDCGHRQVFSKASWNDLAALIGMPAVGVSYSWWCHTHNRHHSQPNEIGADPAIEYDVFAFSESQAVRMRGICRFLVKFQAFYFLPLTLFYPIVMRLNSIRHILWAKPKYRAVETFLFLVHFPLYFWLVFSHLSLGTGLLFVVVHQTVFSLFLVSTFAPNHKGMIILPEHHQMDYLHQQILTAQNVQSHPFAHFWFGGLNFQIEHHLFPNMPRNNLARAQKIIRPFCEKHSIPYQETRAPRCYWDILKFMHQAGAPLRDKQSSIAAREALLDLTAINFKETD